MKKKLIFICCEMGKGGVSKSLASLLNTIDYDVYNVDLFLFSRQGLFLDQVPSNVNILKETTTLRELIFTFKYIAAFKRLLSIVLCKRITSLEKRWRLFWKLNKKSFRPNSKKYDCAISYNDGVELYYMVDCLCANVKIAWNHTNYTNSFTYKPTLDKFYYDRVNYIVTISEECAYTLKRVFPENADKVRIIENIVLKDTLMSLAEVENPYDSYSIDRDTTVICTVAGLYVRKGFDYASVALGNLKKEGIKFLWFIVGGGPEENEIKDLVRNNNIENETFFLHQQSNPYKFVKWADIFLLTSHAEGKSIAIEEAKLLEKPILITHFASAFDQIESGKSGLVAEMTNDSVTEKLRMLIGDKDLQTNLSNYLKNNTHSNRDKNINALYSYSKYKKLVFVSLFITISGVIIGILGVVYSKYKYEFRVSSPIFVTTFIGIILYLNTYKQADYKFTTKYWKYALVLSIPLLPHYLSIKILNQVDRVMITQMVGLSETGLYNLACTVSNLMIIATDAINRSMCPYVYKSIKNKNILPVRKMTSSILLVVMVVSFLEMLIAPELIKIFATDDYLDAIYVIPPVAMSIYFIFLYVVFANVEFYFEKTIFATIVSGIAAVMNIGMNYIFLKKYGYYAAGYTTLICYMLFALLHYWNYKRILKREPYLNGIFDIRHVLLISFSGLALMGICLLLYRYSVIRFSLVIIIITISFYFRNQLKSIIKTSNN